MNDGEQNMNFASLEPDADLRAAIAAATRTPEPQCLPPLIEAARLPAALVAPTAELARRLTVALRAARAGATGVDALMGEFSLSSQEGVALMCLAETLLRVPDRANADRLIREKLARGDWAAHLGGGRSLFVHAAAWGLLISGRLVATASEEGLSRALGRLIAKGGEPLIRKGVDLAMRLLGEQFVAGRTIEEALGRAAQARGYTHSFDMLGEAALTAADAAGYTLAYERAIDAIGAAACGRGIYAGPGISVKLSALHPRYGWAQRARVMAELLPRLAALAARARACGIGLNIDAEEAERLDLSLDLLEALALDPALAGWEGLGCVVQAYQKRAPCVIDWLLDLSRRSRRRLMVRLVKGAYWDSEIKRAQVEGHEGYPVFTRKVYTDVCYLACARRLLAHLDWVFPQFATHNAQTLAAVHQLAGSRFALGDWEFQCLHGMGEPLYDQVVGAGALGRPCRIYAPVGSHETLLAYLVRRLIENGANSSFVNRIVDDSVSLDELTADPVEIAAALAGQPHPRIPLPRDIHAAHPPARVNSAGADLWQDAQRAALEAAVAQARGSMLRAHALVPGAVIRGEPSPVRNPADHGEGVGEVIEADADTIERALAIAAQQAGAWGGWAPARRADILDRAAQALEARRVEFAALLVREAGKTIPNALGEVREAADFCRYYAAQLREAFDAAGHLPLGPVACISPWNFPLAIFVGQVAAALAAGNPVLAKPAEQTPLTAARAVELLHGAGVPAAALQLLPGRGETVGARLTADERVRAVLFTGSTAVAKAIERALAQRTGEAVLIAETGGINAMIVDSTALPEQAVGDALASAFDSAGQRCSALRLLCVQDEIADRVIDMLQGAMRELTIGDPAAFATDVGPVIDEDARLRLEAQLAATAAGGRLLQRLALAPASAAGSFFAPALVEIDAVARLGEEVFGPVLHVLRFDRARLGALIDEIGATGFGLTMGLHTRIDETIALVRERARVGNLYVNRNMIGAVVGVQPFGGEGLSGTGPKAGGPLMLHRLLARSPGPHLAAARRGQAPAAARSLADWVLFDSADFLPLAAQAPLHAALLRAIESSPLALRLDLPGPAGEENTLSFAPRGSALCLAGTLEAGLLQLGAALATGNRALFEEASPLRALAGRLPEAVRGQIEFTADRCAARFDVVLHDGSEADAVELRRELARREGPIVALLRPQPQPQRAWDPMRLVCERSLSVNTAAAGGNASLMTLEPT
jgi:RHH-type proline utilization regulon transcriptional repressor/proline dehydrogenase/delta 1-pyrroline-5-carboxylate dehydrogenase